MAEAKTINKLRYITKFSTEAEAEEAKKRLGIYDAVVSTDKLIDKNQGYLPPYLAEKLKRLRVKLGMSWEIKTIDGEVNYIFVPCDLLNRGLNARAGFGWTKLAFDTQKEFEKLLGYEVRFLFIMEEPKVVPKPT